jgi:SET domain-containing protein
MHQSPIHGQGVFATALIHAGERIMIVGSGGIVYSSQDWKMGKVQLDPDKYNESQIGDDLFIATPMDMAYFFNHSCEPNMWGEHARRDIQPGEEVTTEYALYIFAENYCLAPCRCGSPQCRQRITGNDWRDPELQRRYRGQFPAFIERRMQPGPQ